MLTSFLKSLYADIKKFVLDTLFPIKCIICQAEGAFICPSCAIKLTQLSQQYCIVCKKPSISGLTHPKCQSKYTADALISLYDYHDENVAKILIHGKYYFLPGVYEILGRLLAEKVKKDYPVLLSTNNFPTLTPIPLHKMRQRWRGFNQATILCQSLGQELGLKMAEVLIRKKSTKTQKDLKREARIKNISNAFALSLLPLGEGATRRVTDEGFKQNPQSLTTQNFLLLDDVTTTGSTLSEAAKVLKQNGAGKVFCLTVARD